MKDVFDKVIATGIGLAITSKEQVEKVVDELVKKGEVTKAESSSYVEGLIKKGEESRAHIEETVRERVHSILGERKYISREEFQSIESRLEALERQNSADK
ncbi:MAG: phasin family protein [Candidatus Pristimantibacillus sp.]